MDFQEPVEFSSNLQTKYNSGPATASIDFKTIYFTSNSLDAGDNAQTRKLKIYESHLGPDGKHWSKNIISFPVNSNKYSCARPSLSPDGTKLYFSSDIEWGNGGMDIYVCKRDGNSWGEPINLGPQINSKGNDVFPYVDEDGNLYFASNGRDGLGGLDIFVCRPLGDSFTKPENIGSPINSSRDDFGIVLDKKNKCGYFSSNRVHGGTDDNIYWFSDSKPDHFKFTIKLVDSTSMGKITTAPSVKIKDKNTSESVLLTTDRNGSQNADLKVGRVYTIEAKAENYVPKTITYSIAKNSTELVIPLAKISDGLGKIVVGKNIKMNTIHFASATWDLNDDAVKALDKIVTLMKDNPSIVVELDSHTDCRGTAKSNLELSDNRARACADYVIRKNIDSRRVTSIGYGETIPVNNCECEGTLSVSCSEEEHKANDRIEFKVIGFLRNGIIYSE